MRTFQIFLSSMLLATGVRAATLSVFDVIPVGLSGETAQDAEPSIAVNPVNPQQMIAGGFGQFQGGSTFFSSSNGGTTWSVLNPNLLTYDKSIAYSPTSGIAYAASIYSVPNNSTSYVRTYSTNPGPGFNTVVNQQATSNVFIDQPWIRVGNGAQGDRVYETGNYFIGSSSNTATIHYSTDGGINWTDHTLETANPGAGQDSPSVRVAVSGNTVYTVWNRWNTLDTNAADGLRFGSQIVIQRDDNGGIGGSPFTALGAAGKVVDSGIDTVFSLNDNSAFTLGQERTGSDLALAVDPNNASHVYVAYQQSPAIGQEALIVSESTDGGNTWTRVKTFTTSLRTGEPALAVLTDGTVGLLYDQYDPANGNAGGALSQHFMYTSNDFASVTDLTLGSFTSGNPASAFDPYLGDYFDLQAIGTSFYGIFTSSNQDDGINAMFPNGVTFQRQFAGTPGTGTFQLMNGQNRVGSSIDPFFFIFNNAQIGGGVPEPGTMLLLGGGLALIGIFRKR